MMGKFHFQSPANQSLQNLPSSERHIPSSLQHLMGVVGTTAGHNSTTRNLLDLCPLPHLN